MIYLSTGAGNIIFRRARWYRALYNASQFTLAGFMAAGVFALLGGQPFFEIFHLPGFARIPAAAEAVAQPAFLFAFFAASLALNLVNYTLMAWLMSAVTGRRAWLIWKENCLYSSELQTSFGLTLMTPLFVILYGSLGLIGMGILLLCLALVHQANRRHLAVTKALDNYIRSERMAAMGEMAEEIGRSLGANLEDLKVRANRLQKRAQHTANERVVKSAEIIYENVDRMSALVSGLAAFSHQETHKVPTNLNELIQNTIDFVQPQNRFDGIHFKFIPDPILPRMNLDPAQIQQVLINLLANAADALSEVDRVKRIFIETTFDTNQQKIRVAVTDNGPGIPPENLNRIFEPHFTTKVTGHGFGLPTVFRIASNHRGTVRAMNVPEAGARFLLELPNS